MGPGSRCIGYLISVSISSVLRLPHLRVYLIGASATSSPCLPHRCFAYLISVSLHHLPARYPYLFPILPLCVSLDTSSMVCETLVALCETTLLPQCDTPSARIEAVTFASVSIFSCGGHLDRSMCLDLSVAT
jgi:hypothetical protein